MKFVEKYSELQSIVKKCGLKKLKQKISLLTEKN